MSEPEQTAGPKQLTCTGTCLCGAVSFEIDAPFRDVVICHCTQCAKWTGHLVAATSVSNDRFRVTSGDDALQWYASSDHAKRGFCSTCGSSMFWHPANEDRVSVMAGTLDDPTDMHVGAQIHTGDQRSYVASADVAKRFEGPSNTALATPLTGTTAPE